MIRAMIFDLDGTLVQTERLKTNSYAKAVKDLCPYSISEEELVGAYKQVVGLPRRKVAKSLVKHFDLEGKARTLMDEFGVVASWQAFVQIRLNHYSEMLSDPEMLAANQWPPNRDVLETARKKGCTTALATMSHCEQAQRVVRSLGLKDDFDFIATKDDVEAGKPDPEIYPMVASELDIAEQECLVLEDSPTGVEAALNAGMWCIAVTTPFTKDQIHTQGILDERWIVDNPDRVTKVVEQRVSERED